MASRRCSSAPARKCRRRLRVERRLLRVVAPEHISFVVPPVAWLVWGFLVGLLFFFASGYPYFLFFTREFNGQRDF